MFLLDIVAIVEHHHIHHSSAGAIQERNHDNSGSSFALPLGNFSSSIIKRVHILPRFTLSIGLLLVLCFVADSKEI
jgi:hypothetical protein